MSLVGQELGRYRIGALLHRDAEVEVYQAVQGALGRPVAIQVLREAPARDPSRRRRFQEEGRALARLAHPHLETIYDSGSLGDRPYRVRELLSEETLEDALSAGPAPLLTARLEAGADLAAALAYLHARGLSHGDLRARRVRFDKGGNVVLTGAFRAADGTPARDREQLGRVLDRLLGDPRATAPPEVGAFLDRLRRGELATSQEVHRALRRLQRRARLRSLPREDAPGTTRTGMRSLPPGEEASTGSLPPSPRRGLGPAGLVAAAALVGLPLVLVSQLSTPNQVVEQQVEAGPRHAALRWRLVRPGASWVEYWRAGDTARRSTRPRPGAAFQVRIEGLRPSTRYAYRFGIAASPEARAARFGPLHELTTPAGLEIRDLQVVARRADRVTVRWTTNLETGTRVRLGPTGGPYRIRTNPDQPRELVHDFTLHGLDPDTSYEVQVLAASPSAAAPEQESPWLPFRTTAARDAAPTPLASLARQYLVKLDTLPPDERERFRRTLEEAFPTRTTSERKDAALGGATDSATFHPRRRLLELWIDELEASGAPLPAIEGRSLEEECRYLRDLVTVNPARAFRRLDAALETLRRVEEERARGPGPPRTPPK